MSSKSFKTTTASTPYCKVCHDAGRPSSEYTSHYVKDQPGPDGKVVCPTLLNQNCRICQKPGHTSTYCSQYRSRRDDRPPRYIEREEPRRDDRRDDDRRSKPWLQAAMANPPRDRREPYAHPHGPRVRLELESRALSSATVQPVPPVPVPMIDVMKVNLHHATNWCDEEPEQMADAMFKELANESFITRDDDELLEMSCSGGQCFSSLCD